MFGGKLPGKGGSGHRADWGGAFECAHDVHHLASFKDGTEGTGHDAAAAADTFAVVDFCRAVLVFGDGVHGAFFFAGHGYFGNRAIGADGFAFAAVFTFCFVDVRSSVGDGDSAKGADSFAGTGKTALA